MADTKVGFPQGPEKGDESVKATLAELIRQYEDDPEALERILEAGQEAAKHVEESRIDKGPDFVQQNADACRSFMERYGINKLLSSADPDRLKNKALFGLLLVNKTPIEISQRDFDALFGSAIKKHNIKHAAFMMVMASILMRTPDGKLYKVNLTKAKNGTYEPFEYFETNLKQIKADEEALIALGEGVDDTRDQIASGLS